MHREIRQEQDSDTTLDQDFVAPASCYMSIEVVSVRMREHQHLEGTPSGVVFWTAAGRDAAGIVRRKERMKEFEGGRRPTTGRSGTKGEMNRQTTQESEETKRTDRSISSIRKKKLI